MHIEHQRVIKIKKIVFMIRDDANVIIASDTKRPGRPYIIKPKKIS
jgi:hypothetical protein